MDSVLRHRRAACALGGLVFAVTALAARPSAQRDDALAAVLDRATERVEYFFTRAQSLVCTETVHMQPLSSGWSSDGFGRTVESELRLSWDPGAEGDAATEAQAVRVVTRVNGHAPRENDRNNCTTPERHDTETQVLSMLLESQRGDYVWSLGGRGRVDRREAILLDYRERERLSMTVTADDDDADCLTYTLRGGGRGRLWIDAETFDVLRLDARLGGQANAPMPKAVQRRPGASATMTVERFDTSYRFRRVQFADPEESLVLPVSSVSLRITHGGGTPRMRVTTEYRKYRRFLTGARIVPDPGQ
ncbi:MAG: hypothetical protein R2708_15890 [Vicinamibacterales bacterium]